MEKENRLRINEAWRMGTERLRAAEVDEAEANSELLLLHVLGIGKAELLRDLREPFPEGKRELWERVLDRKAAGEPAQYIIGEQEFYGRPFRVTPDVLIPRPETELLAEAVLAEAAGWGEADGNAGTGLGGLDLEAAASRGMLDANAATCGNGTAAGEAGSLGQEIRGGRPLVLLDVGTGSGALAVTLAAERKDWRVLASDLSPAALDVARGNAAANGVGDRIEFVEGDLLTPFLCSDERPEGVAIDILVSNPPYIRSEDMPGLQREVRDFEPHLALDGGEDGLTPYRRMAAQLARLPRLPRLVAWEMGAGQADDAAKLLRAVADWREIRYVKDYAGIDRHVIAVKD